MNEPIIEVYDEDDNWLPVVKVTRKPSGVLVVTVQAESTNDAR